MLRLLVIGSLATAALLLTRRPAGERGNAVAGFPERPVRGRRAEATSTSPRRSAPSVDEREQAARELAEQLLFQLDKHGRRYSLFRDADVSEPVRHENLTLKQVEETLSTWKLRGFHGG